MANNIRHIHILICIMLTMKKSHSLFIDAYTNPKEPTFKNASASARHAGYAPKSANITGYKLLQKPEIKEEIANKLGTAIDLKAKREYKNKEWIIDRIGEFIGANELSVKGAENRSQANTILKYLELYAKLNGWFDQSINITNVLGIKNDKRIEDLAIKFSNSIKGTVGRVD